MRRKELMKLYTVDNRVDPITGRDKKVARYTGKRYRVDMAAKRRLLPVLWATVALILAAFVAGGLLNNPGSRCMWVLPFYMFCMLPLCYGLMAAVRLTRMKEIITEVDMADGVRSMGNSALGLTILGALWAATDVVFLILGGGGQSVAREIVFLLCGMVTAGSAFALRRALDAATPEEIREKEESSELDEELDEKTEEKQS